MSEHTKQYDNFDEMLKAAQLMRKFQILHNVIRKDYIELLRITEDNNSTAISFNALYRASLRSLFSLIEADIYTLNVLDQYKDYFDADSFLDKFKETFKQIARSWQKEEIQKKYFDSKLKELIKLKKMRDELIHPKEVSHVHIANAKDFDSLKSVFNDYDTFINDLMKDFFVGTIMQ